MTTSGLLRWAFAAHSSRHLLDDAPALAAFRKYLVDSLHETAAANGHTVVGEPTIHEPIPLWWVDVPDPITGVPTSMLVGEYVARFHTHTRDCRTVDGRACCSAEDDLGDPAAYAWRTDGDVLPGDA